MKYEAHFNEAKENISDSIVDALEEIGKFGTAEAQVRCPVGKYPPSSGRTGGKLRRSLGYEHNDKDTVNIGTNVEYAPYVHNGTSRQKAQPFIKDAIMQNINEINNIIKKYLSKVGDK